MDRNLTPSGMVRTEVTNTKATIDWEIEKRPEVHSVEMFDVSTGKKLKIVFNTNRIPDGFEDDYDLQISEVFLTRDGKFKQMFDVGIRKRLAAYAFHGINLPNVGDDDGN